MRAIALAVTLALAVAAPPVALAGTLSDSLFAPGAFDVPALGAAHRWPLTFRHEHGTASETLSLAPRHEDGRTELVLTRGRDGAGVEITRFPATSINPLVLYFLEAVVRSVAEATGGSPFYIRNRIREAVATADLPATGDAGARQRATLTPFAADPNAARMGAFAELVLVVTVAPGVPGRVLELSADTPGNAAGYHERLTLDPEPQ